MPTFDGHRIKVRREMLGITQEGLAEAIGTTQKSISDYERNTQTNIQADRLIKLADTLGVSVGYFFADEHEMDGLESLVIEEFRALPSEEAKHFALKFIRDLQQFTRKSK